MKTLRTISFILSLLLLVFCYSCEAGIDYKTPPAANNPWLDNGDEGENPDDGEENPDEGEENPDEGEENPLPTVPTGEIPCMQVDPLAKIYLEDNSFPTFAEVLPYAKGETASFQFVVRYANAIENMQIEAGVMTNGSTTISPSLVAFERYTRAGLHLAPYSNVAFFPASDKYPDCLDESESMSVPANTNQPLWVNYAIPKTATAGVYTGTVVVKGMVGSELYSKTMNVSFEVRNVTLPEQTLYISNWANFDHLNKMNDWNAVEPHSDLYYELMTIVVKHMAAYGNNVYYIDPLLSFVDCTKSGSQWTFSFAKFNRVVEIMVTHGKAKMIECGHLAKRVDANDFNSAFGVKMPENRLLPLSDSEAKEFLSQFMTALKNNLSSRGWLDLYAQHIGDEPVDANTASYVEIAKYVKSIVPDVKIIDAIMTTTAMDNVIDIWVPLLDFWHQRYSFYNERRLQGDQAWFYTCLSPKGNYANRFMNQPLIQTRLLHWLNYKYTATGYLHWGYNQAWNAAWSFVGTDGFCTAGDCFIAYPAYRKAYSSIRFEAMRDGIADYELLRLLDSRDPSTAHNIVNSMVYDFDSYNNSNAALRSARKQLLDALD